MTVDSLSCHWIIITIMFLDLLEQAALMGTQSRSRRPREATRVMVFSCKNQKTHSGPNCVFFKIPLQELKQDQNPSLIIFTYDNWTYLELLVHSPPTASILDLGGDVFPFLWKLPRFQKYFLFWISWNLKFSQPDNTKNQQHNLGQSKVCLHIF